MLLLQLLINGAVNAAVIALLAIGFGMVYRSMRFFHIAYGAIYVQTSYITLSLMNFLPVLLAVAGGLISAALAGTFMELIVYSPSVHARQAQLFFLLLLWEYMSWRLTVLPFYTATKCAHSPTAFIPLLPLERLLLPACRSDSLLAVVHWWPSSGHWCAIILF